jgi:sulfoxide reductase heme-binding subunit YedZ
VLPALAPAPAGLPPELLPAAAAPPSPLLMPEAPATLLAPAPADGAEPAAPPVPPLALDAGGMASDEHAAHSAHTDQSHSCCARTMMAMFRAGPEPHKCRRKSAMKTSRLGCWQPLRSPIPAAATRASAIKLRFGSPSGSGVFRRAEADALYAGGVLRPRVAKALVSILCTFPAIDLIRVLYQHNPHFVRDYDFAAFSLSINVSGGWAFVFLFLALACTPVQRLTRSAWVAAVRRPLGVAAFGYCLLHFLAYFVIGQKLNVSYLFEDSLQQPSRIPGWLSLLLLVPLALTSTDGMARRLGGKRWKLLHRLVYPATALAILHVYWVERDHYSDFHATRNTLVPFVVLMLARLVRFRVPRL